MGRLLGRNFVAEFSSAGVLTGNAWFDGRRYSSLVGTSRGLRDLLRPVSSFLSGIGSAGVFKVQYSCVSSHGDQDPFFPSTMSSGVGGGIVGEDGNKRGFTYVRL